MGAPMAARLADAGYPLVVYDSDAAAARPFAARGATTASSPADLASAVDIVFICLPTPAVVKEVTTGANGIIAGSRARLVIDLGTTGPVMSRAVAADLSARNIALVDCPVTGGVSGAVAGTLAMIVACPSSVFDTVAPMISVLGKIFRVGENAGQAQVAKLANNMLSAAALAVTSEVVAFGTRAGLDPHLLIEIINAGSGRNSATQDKFPKAILPGTYDAGMKTGLFLKDIRLCLAEAEALGVPMVVGEAVRQLFSITQARRGFSSDFTRIAEVIADWNDNEPVAGSGR
jgi:3-hydroxyisobutyrate dehydrogenase-like beta-hydroxyacid dehydrogenase